MKPDTIYKRKWRGRYPEKAKAQGIITRAISNGNIERPANCSGCGIKCKPESHHPDYNKPFDIVWLCRKCHLKKHPYIVENRQHNKSPKIIEATESLPHPRINEILQAIVDLYWYRKRYDKMNNGDFAKIVGISNVSLIAIIHNEPIGNTVIKRVLRYLIRTGEIKR